MRYQISRVASLHINCNYTKKRHLYFYSATSRFRYEDHWALLDVGPAKILYFAPAALFSRCQMNVRPYGVSHPEIYSTIEVLPRYPTLSCWPVKKKRYKIVSKLKIRKIIITMFIDNFALTWEELKMHVFETVLAKKLKRKIFWITQ